jgi:hypothetical protein
MRANDEGGSLHSDEVMPLCEYAAEHWTSHAQVGNVSSCLKDAMETLFDPNKPYFEAWIQIHYVDTIMTIKQCQLYIRCSSWIL